MRQTSTKLAKKPAIFQFLAFFLIIGVLIALVFWGLRSFCLNFSGFKITKVSIIDIKGKTLLNPEKIFRLEKLQSIFSLDIKTVVEDIRARHPEFAHVFIRKQFPDALLIMVAKREPVAIVGEKRFLSVDAEGFIFPFEPSYMQLPKIIGVSLQQIHLYEKSSLPRLKKSLSLIAELKKARIFPEYNVAQIDVRRISDVVFYFQNGIEVKMGEANFSEKVLLLKEVLVQLKRSGTVPKYIDLRFGDPLVFPVTIEQRKR